jgi:hypothetical protein
MRFTSRIRLPNYLLSLNYFIFTTIVITFLTVFILTHPVNFPCGRKPSTRRKLHDDFRQSVDWLFHTSPRDQLIKEK